MESGNYSDMSNIGNSSESAIIRFIRVLLMVNMHASLLLDFTEFDEYNMPRKEEKEKTVHKGDSSTVEPIVHVSQHKIV